MSERSQPGPNAPQRLAPDRATAAVPERTAHVAPVIDTRRYQWMIGILGVALVAAFSVYMLVGNGIDTPGIPAGGQLREFVAPLATSGIDRPANAQPRCDPARPNPDALNVCRRTPLVLDLFVAGSADCTRSVGVVQRVATQFRGIQFAAVSVRGSLRQAAGMVRAHRWTIPVAVDEDGRVGELYGVEICPMIELARPGGLVVARLIGDRWNSAARLAATIRAKLGP